MRRGLLRVTLLLTTFVHRAVGTWMYLGIASVASTQEACSHVPGMVVQQMQLCRDNPQAIPCIRDGARRGIYECYYQFQNERWNCTIIKNKSVLGPVLNTGTKETAFIYAVTSAGVTHAVTRSCSAGNLTDCSCYDMSGQAFPTTMKKRGEPGATEIWKWGGCSDNVDYGVWFGKTFVDAQETMHHVTVKRLMNLHNNEVGRKIIQRGMKTKCRCHGVSGSCAVKTCWRAMPTFREIGDSIKRKYQDSVKVAPRSKKKLRRKEKDLRKRRIPSDVLVYSEDSPDYCRPDYGKGIVGTSGRQCNKTSKGPDSCDLLCCGRGYNTQIVHKVERCQCKFVWCCYVKCKICESVIDRYTCK